MIQRIQTLYMALVVILCGLLFCPFAQPMLFTANDDYVSAETLDWSLWVMNGAIAAIALTNIFLYKKRILQVRINIVNVVLMVGYYIMLVVYTYFNIKALQGLDPEAAWHINWSAGLPLVGVVLTMMAVRAILKDEALVRAADRLR